MGRIVALDTVADFMSEARTLLQDQVAPYRYPDQDLVTALNMALFDALRIRPDLFVVGAYTGPLDGDLSLDPEPVTYSLKGAASKAGIPRQYRMAFLNYIVGQAQMRDTEDTQDTRAVGFKQMFASSLMT
jgi:hypothetical protein